MATGTGDELKAFKVVGSSALYSSGRVIFNRMIDPANMESSVRAKIMTYSDMSRGAVCDASRKSDAITLQVYSKWTDDLSKSEFGVCLFDRWVKVKSMESLSSVVPDGAIPFARITRDDGKDYLHAVLINTTNFTPG
jgi:hypothetical protein